MTKIFGIDVSYHNGTIDWTKVKNNGVKFAILRAGRTSLSSSKNMAKDVKFEEYYKQAKAIGIPVGAYYYSRCATVSEGKAEGKFIVNLIRGKKFEYPVFLDIEDTEVLKKTSKRQLTDAVKAMAKVVEDAGYYVAIYSGKYILREHLIESELSKYDKWIAHYAKECGYKEKDLMMWQFGGETNLLRNKKINGVPSASTDQNYCYVDYTSLIKSKGLNGFNKPITNEYITNKVPYYVITKGKLNIRKSPTTEADILHTAPKGVRYKITKISKNGKWGYAPYRKGWLSLNKKYVSVEI